MALIPNWLVPVDAAAIAARGTAGGLTLRAQDIGREEAAARLRQSYDALAINQAQDEARLAAASQQAADQLAASKEEAAMRLQAMQEQDIRRLQSDALKMSLTDRAAREKLALDRSKMIFGNEAAEQQQQYRNAMLDVSNRRLQIQSQPRPTYPDPTLVPQYDRDGNLIGFGFGKTFIPATDKPGVSPADMLLERRLSAERSGIMDSTAGIPIKLGRGPESKEWKGATSDAWQRLQDIELEREAILERSRLPRSRFGAPAPAPGATNRIRVLSITPTN
jgi:hypothetical protein